MYQNVSGWTSGDEYHERRKVKALESFSATIYKIGINPVVDPPPDMLAAIFEQAGKSKGPIPVCGNLNAAGFVQTLVKYKGAWRLYINGEMLKASGLKVGETAEIEIEFDPRPREVPMPEIFKKALADNPAAQTAFQKLAPYRQKEILRYLGFLKNEASLLRNTDRVLRHLLGETSDALHALMRREKGD